MRFNSRMVCKVEKHGDQVLVVIPDEFLEVNELDVGDTISIKLWPATSKHPARMIVSKIESAA